MTRQIIINHEWNRYNYTRTFQRRTACESAVLLILLDNLFYGGRSVNEHVIRLDKSPVSKQKEFVRFCNESLDKDGLCFGEKPQEGQINIFEKNVINSFICPLYCFIYFSIRITGRAETYSPPPTHNRLFARIRKNLYAKPHKKIPHEPMPWGILCLIV